MDSYEFKDYQGRRLVAVAMLTGNLLFEPQFWLGMQSELACLKGILRH
jgi:hypothetical protein